MANGRKQAGRHIFDWKAYFERTKDQPPRPLLVRAMGFVHTRDHAIDLGSGALNDSRFLLNQRFKHVTAIDEIPMATDVSATFPADRFDYIISTFEEFDFPSDRFDLVNAQNSLSFIAPDHFDRVFESVRLSVKNGGVFTGQLFGERDDWASSRPDMTFRAAEQIEQQFAQMKVIELREGEEDGRAAEGTTKHRHFIRFIVQRAVGGSATLHA